MDLAGSVVFVLVLSVAAGCGGQPHSQNPPTAQTTTTETTAAITGTPLSGLPSGPTCATALGVPGTDCLAANCVVQDGKRIVSLQWKRDASCVASRDKTILENVVRFRQTGDTWSMSNYVSIPDSSTAMSFTQPFEPGSYELSVKLRPNSEQNIVMTVK